MEQKRYEMQSICVHEQCVTTESVTCITGSVTKYTGEKIVDKISEIVTNTTKQYYICVGQVMLFIQQ